MSAFHAENMWDGLYIGAAVYWGERQRAGLDPCGKIHAFVWHDIPQNRKENGVVIEFEQDTFIIRFFISFEQLKLCTWLPGNGGTFFIDTALFVELQKNVLMYFGRDRLLRIKGKRTSIYL